MGFVSRELCVMAILLCLKKNLILESFLLETHSKSFRKIKLFVHNIIGEQFPFEYSSYFFQQNRPRINFEVSNNRKRA